MGFIYFKTQTYNPMLLKRVLIYGGLLVVLSMLPQFTLLNLKYRAHPEYADALKKSIANPGDTTLRAKVDAERVKMNR
jgi:hypothetical protein